MKAFILLITLYNLFLIIHTNQNKTEESTSKTEIKPEIPTEKKEIKPLSITNLKKKTDFEDIIFKSNKAWLVVVYANWDTNKDIWLNLWDFIKVDFAKDEIDIELGRFDVVDGETGVPDMGILKQ
jgi:hypothetical protein